MLAAKLSRPRLVADGPPAVSQPAAVQGPLHFAGRLATLLRLRRREEGALSDVGEPAASGPAVPSSTRCAACQLVASLMAP